MTAGVRAATMTFAVYYDDPSIAGWLRGRVEQITGKHPSRVIILDGSKDVEAGSPDDDSTPRAWSDVAARGLNAADLAASVTRLQLPDAPLVLAWIAHLDDDERFATLAKRANTIIVSASALGEGDTALRDICAFSAKHRDVVLHDVAYLRLGTWQEIIAEFFDEERARQALSDIRRVEIVSGSDAEALYLIAWLASRLQWKPCRDNELCNSSDETIEFSIQRGGLARRISRVTLKSADTTFNAEVHQDDEDAIVSSVRGKFTKDSRNVPVTKVDIASLFERAVLHPNHDPIFNNALETVIGILEHRAP